MNHTELLTDYLRRMGWKRFFFLVMGNIILGMGVGLFLATATGCDPFNGMNVEVAKFLPLSYATYQLLVNLVLFAVEFAFGRSLIGCGTILNACFLGYINSFFYSLFSGLFGSELSLMLRLVGVLLAVVLCSFGLSLYQTPNAGVAPYDSLPIILHGRFPRASYFWWRMLCDVTCATVCLLAGGLASGNLGIGTLICAFCFGPVIQFFNSTFTRKHITPMASK